MREDFRFEDEQFSFQPEVDPEADLEFPAEELEAKGSSRSTADRTTATSRAAPAVRP
jgi:hypothetical protein